MITRRKHETITTPGELPKEGRARGSHGGRPQIVHAVADDPNPAFRGQRQRVAVNILSDPLEAEYRRGRVGEAAYRAGRIYQAVLERSRGQASGGGVWRQGDRVDAATAHEAAILASLDRAGAAVAMLDDTARVVGQVGGRVLELVLLDRRTLTQVAEIVCRDGSRQHVWYVANTFRASLEDLATHWASRNACPPRTRA